MERRKARLGSWCRSMIPVLGKQRPRKRLSDVPPRRSFSLGPLFEGTGGKPTARRSRRISRRHLHLAQPSRGRPPWWGRAGSQGLPSLRLRNTAAGAASAFGLPLRPALALPHFRTPHEAPLTGQDASRISEV